MKRIFPTILCLLFALPLAGQPDFSIAPETGPVKTKNSFLITSDFFFASNAMTYELAKTYFLNGFITDEMKYGVSSHLDEKNRLGGEFNVEIYFRYKPASMFGRTDLSWFTGVKNINHLNSAFSRDLFEVYFRGNKNYGGKTADFSDFNYMLLKYQQLQFGLARTVLKDTARFEMGAAIGFNMGQQLLRVQSRKADLYTEDIGAYFDINADIETHNSDSAHKNFGSFNGFGVSTDLFFKSEALKKHFLFARISNLGFIRWNNQSAETKADTSFRFEGVDVSNLFNFADTIESILAFDSTIAQPFLSNRKYNSYTLLLPAKIEVSYKRAIGRNIRAGIGANYYLNADYLPLVSLDGDYSWRNSRVALTVSYGGYTTFGTGIFLQHRFSRGYVLILGSNYINSLFNIDKSISQNIHFTFYRNF